MKHLLKLGGMTPEEILHILDVADEYKRLHKGGVDPKAGFLQKLHSHPHKPGGRHLPDGRPGHLPERRRPADRTR